MSNPNRLLPVAISAALLAACGGGGSGSSGSMSSTSTSTSTPQSANLAVMVSDASTEDWATIGVKVLSIALIPQGGGSNVTVYTAPSPAPTTNLVMLDQLDDLIGNAIIPVGTYTGAVLTVSGNPSDILLADLVGSGGRLCRRAGVTINCEPDPSAAHSRIGLELDRAGHGSTSTRRWS